MPICPDDKDAFIPYEGCILVLPGIGETWNIIKNLYSGISIDEELESIGIWIAFRSVANLHMN